MRRVLLVEKDSLVRDNLAGILRDEKFYVIAVKDRSLALNCLERESIDIMLVDEDLLSMAGYELLDRARTRFSEIVVIATGKSDSPFHIRTLLTKGIYDYVSLPLTPSRILSVVRRASEKISLMEENRVLRRRIDDRFSFAGITGVSEVMQGVFSFILQVSQVRRPVLLVGEQGTGKEMVARAIHRYAFSDEKPFFKILCGNLPQGILKNRIFYRELREGRVLTPLEGFPAGTVYLEDIHLLPQQLQAELADFLEDHRLGTKDRDIRIIASCEVSLGDEAARGAFRTDLYYFLNALRVEVPPLRHRKEDIPFLIDCFLKEFAQESGKPEARMGKDALRALIDYDWPGNVTELRNTIEGILVLSEGEIELSDIPDHIHQGRYRGDSFLIQVGMTLEEVEKHLIRETLKANRFNKSKSARMLDIGLRTLYRKIKQYDLDEELYAVKELPLKDE